MSFFKRLFGESKPKTRPNRGSRSYQELLPAQEMYGDTPAGLRAYLLEQLVIELIEQDKGDPFPYSREADRIYDIMYQRNERGINVEKVGDVEQAIDLYEQNVTDWFDGNHPYDRLRIIYTKRKQYDDAIRVCQTFVDMADALLELGSPRSDLPPKREKFVEWVQKLQKRKGSSK